MNMGKLMTVKRKFHKDTLLPAKGNLGVHESGTDSDHILNWQTQYGNMVNQRLGANVKKFCD